MARRVKKMSFKAQLVYVMLLALGLLFIPTTIILVCGMAPTAAAALIDVSKRKLKVLTVGLLNFAGCSYSLLLLWTTGHTIDNAFNILLNIQNMLIILFSAGGGYMVEIAMTGLVSSYMFEKSKSRLNKIEKRQEELQRRWGEEVNGKIPLDVYGFPIKMDEDDRATNSLINR